MKLIVFGGTGRQVVVQALEEGHEVAVVVRRPETFELRHDKLKVVKGDVLMPATFRQATNGPRTEAYRTTVNKPLLRAKGISRADLANFMIQSIADRSTYQAVVEISD